MNIKTELDLITLLASVLSVVGAFFLVRSIILTGSKQIASMSGTYIGSNPHLQAALVQQKADSIVGFALTFFSGLFWVFTVFFSCNLPSIETALALAVGSIIVIGITSHFISKKIFSKMKLKVCAISFAFHVESYLKPYNISNFKADKLIADAKKDGLDELLNPALDAHANLAQIMIFAGAKSGADHILELRDKNHDVT